MIKKVLLVTILVFALILVRFFQYDLFYDPFLYYFKNSYLDGAFPEFSWIKMTAFLLLRFSINTAISLAIIYILFKDSELIKLSLIIYTLLFLVLLPIYYYYIDDEFEGGYLAAFYVRRFLIQPLLLFLLVPAFFYQKKVEEE